MILMKRFLCTSVVLVALIALFTVCGSGISDDKTAPDAFYSSEYKLICISHRGDTVSYPENSLQGVKSALEKGADFVSVNLDKTSDGIFYLCEDESLGNICDAPYDKLSDISSADVEKYFLFDVYGKKTEYKLCSLKNLIDNTDEDDGIILDIKSEDKDAVYEVLKAEKALSRMIIRVEESGKNLSSWIRNKEENVYVIGKYTGNIIFSTISQINSLTAVDAPAVQYESKNYFNVCFGEFFTNRYLIRDKVRAVAATYSSDLCGLRGDSSDGWNELIGKGYSVIETNNTEAFIAYRNEADSLKASVGELLLQCEAMDMKKYSQVSVANLNKAKTECEKLMSDFVFSLDEAQRAYSELVFALNDMKISTGEVDTRGALNVTVGKVVSAIIVGFALLAGQIYVYKMRKSNKEKN